jgi:hypothetical protein
VLPGPARSSRPQRVAPQQPLRIVVQHPPAAAAEPCRGVHPAEPPPAAPPPPPSGPVRSQAGPDPGHEAAGPAHLPRPACTVAGVGAGAGAGTGEGAHAVLERSHVSAAAAACRPNSAAEQCRLALRCFRSFFLEGVKGNWTRCSDQWHCSFDGSISSSNHNSVFPAQNKTMEVSSI